MASGVLLHMQVCQPVNIDFRDITYTVTVPKHGKKRVLQGVSGEFCAGQLTAIMGPSGAGKSSLLNVLTGLQRSDVTGNILMNGRDRNSCHAEFRKQACFIQQDDPLLPRFTTHELMMAAADLKLGSSMGHKAKALLVEDIMEALGLVQSRDTRCEMLSGGQRKRLSIALELANNPATMFLDEPTTGLDSSSSLQCVSLLKSLARTGRNMVCTIHQPSAAALQMFDLVYVLAEGRCVFRGSPQGMIPFLDKVGLPCPQYHSPADHLLDVASGEYGPHTDALAAAARDQPAVARGPPFAGGGIVHEMCPNDGTVTTVPPRAPTPVQMHPPSEWTRFPILLNRCIMQLHRDWTMTHLKMALHTAVGVILGLNFAGCGNDASKSFNNISYLFCVSIYLSYTSMMPALLRYPAEVLLLKKEWFNNWYKLRTYYAACLVANIPIQLVYCTLFCSITYFMSSQPVDLTRFGMFLGVCMLTTLVAESVGMQLGTMFLGNLVQGLFFGSIFLAFLLVFSGFLVLLSHMPIALGWLSNLSYVRYSLQGMMVSVYGYGRERIPCPPAIVYCHLRDPPTILQEMGMRDIRYWQSIVALVSFFLVIRTATYINLRRKISSG